MLEAMGMALVNLADPQVLLFITAGCFIGLFVSLMPGIGDLTAIALLLPLVVGLSPESSLSFIMGELAVGGVAGSITAILVAIPGDGPSIVTVLDGYPMNQKGQGARAIGASVFASVYGALGSVLIVMFLVMLIRPIVLNFGSAELFMMITLGLSFVILLSGKALLKGLIAAGIGVILSMIGFDPRSGMSRFTFDILFFYEGIALAVLGLGLFGVAVMYETLSEGEATISMTKELPKWRDVMSGVWDVFHHWRIFWMGAALASIIGTIPGLGRMTAAWVSYGLAKRLSKNPEEFGKGCIEGVIAPGAADNSTAAGSLLTSLTFGVPGSSTMALFLGAVIMAGLVPGPALVREHLDMVYLLIFGIALANIIGGSITLFTANQLAKIAFVPMDYLFPGLMALIAVAAFVTQGSVLTMIPLIFGAALGIAMRKFKYPLGPLILAFVLGHLFEYYLFNALDFWGPLFFLRPICVAIAVVIFALFGYKPLVRFIKQRRRGGRATSPIDDYSQDTETALGANDTKSHITGMRLQPSTYFALIIMAVMVALIGNALALPYIQSAVLPVIVGSLLFILSGIQVGKEILGKGVINAQKKPRQDAKHEYKQGMSLGVFAAWTLGFYLAIIVLGHLIAVPLFCLSYAKWHRKSWVSSVVSAVSITAFIYIVFPLAFKITLYPGIIFDVVSGG